MEYLLAAVKASRRRLQLEHWLLLAIRTLLVILVVLAVAEPFFEHGYLSFLPGERTHRLLVIDGSFSMAYRPTEESRFDRARKLATEIVDESPQGDGFTLVLMSSPPQVVVGTPVFEQNDFLHEIDALRLPHTTADLPATLEKIEQILTSARTEFPRLVREEVYFITDLGRVGWEPHLAGPAAVSRFRQRSTLLARSAAVVIVDVGQSGAENSAVCDIRAAEPFVTIADNVTVEADIKCFGHNGRARVPVEFLVDGRRVDQQHVDLSPGTQSSVAFMHRFKSPGDHAVEVRLANDRLEVDDHRRLAVPVKQSTEVLLVDGSPSGGRFGGATDFLAFALAPGSDDLRPAVVRPHVVPESALLELDLSPYDAVFLANVAQFTASEARVLDAYLESGGSLVFFLGDRVMADRYNRQLASQQPGGIDLLPARLGAVVDETEFGLDPLEYRHPIVEAFKDRERTGLLTTPIYKHFQLIVPEQSPSKVVLATAGDDPLIVERPVHRGRVVLVATSADTAWTPMPMWPSYVPIVQELLAFSVSGRVSRRNLEVGQPLGESFSTPLADASLYVQVPGGASEKVRLRTEGDATTWSFLDTLVSGLYTARFDPPVLEAKTFAVNVDPAESDLSRITPEELREDVWPDVPFVVQTGWEGTDAGPTSPISRSSFLPKALLYAVLLLLLAETYFARRFGYHGQ